MTEQEILATIQATQAIRHGHFQLTSGRHSDTYFQCARILEHPRLTRQLAGEVVARLPEALRSNIDLVASPAVGGILFGFAVADALDVPMVFSKRVDGAMQFRRSFEVSQGAKVLVAEDVVTSGGSVCEVIELVEAAGGEVTAVTALVDRGGTPLFSRAFYALIRLETPSWPAADCELCKQEIPLYAPGSRAFSMQNG